MSAILSAAQLRDITERTANATAGPWGMFNGFGPVAHDGKHRALYVGQLSGGERILETGGPRGAYDLIATREDFEFLAAARSDIPALLATVAALREALKPFAETGARLPPEMPDCLGTTASFRRAAAVYAETA